MARRIHVIGAFGTTVLVGWVAIAAAPAQETMPLESEETIPLETAPEAAPPLQITVNAASDGPVMADEQLTLREAIELANGNLPVAALSSAEQTLVQPRSVSGSEIIFALPPDDTTIELMELLPPITAAGTTIDGTTQPGYGALPVTYPGILAPVVSLTPAAGAEVFRGLTIAANDVTVRGLSLYGFTASDRSTQTTPPADIFISNAPPPEDAGPGAPGVGFFNFTDATQAASNVVIENNWLGIPPDESVPEQRSAFGVSVFNSTGAIIRQNRMHYHDGSAVITGFRAEDMQLTDNVIVGNGLAGMPDAVRLEGKLAGANIAGNLICGNDGSGIFMFKPEGATTITNNDIRFNGRRFQRAAVYVMGSDHQITDNIIGYQPGPGVSVAAFPSSDRNLIRNNQFAVLDGLSIDLATQGNTGVRDFQQADGPNPPRVIHHQRTETGNGAINAPEFDGYTFSGEIQGKADPNTDIDLYQVVEDDGVYGPLATPLATVKADDQGNFSWRWDNPDGGWISAIASDPDYGTSEPSPAIEVLGTDGTAPPRFTPQPYVASCAPPQPRSEPEPEPTPVPLQLEVPRNIHFALDRADITPESAAVLDEITAVMLAYPYLTLELQGHTDPRASVAYNQALSERRALAARNYLINQGVPAERMRILPLGESQRATTGSTRLDYARDRRVEVIFHDTRGLDIKFINQEDDLQLE
jgi:outer membrane protein OmpA-like peptidoglycan-associated protein